MRKYSMTSHNRRNHQRWLNYACRMMNKNIYDDDLWRGRFVVEQVYTNMEWFEDKSGGIMYCLLRFRDKKTNQTVLWSTDCLTVNSQLWWRMNKFITEDCDVWSKEDPYKSKESWR